MSKFMDLLRSGRPVYQETFLQPMKATVGKPEFKARNVVGWDRKGVAIHATTAILSAPAYGSTKPNDFITIQGQMPKAPVVVQVPTIAGSNIPQGGGLNGWN